MKQRATPQWVAGRVGLSVIALAAIAMGVALAFTPLPAAGLCAAYAFDEGSGKSAADASGNNLTGELSRGVAWTTGKYGKAVSLIGNGDNINLGNPPSLRITGSLTLSAWINSRFFPYDDAPIISKIDGSAVGYQLDTTIDQGPRTIGFKLNNPSGTSGARYGATALKTGEWYHVAGVYDASRHTMDVYLNGQLDNGPMAGKVPDSQRDSRDNVNIGRRPGITVGVFAGFLDDVRIYSRPLSQAEILADMNAPLGKP